MRVDITDKAPQQPKSLRGFIFHQSGRPDSNWGAVESEARARLMKRLRQTGTAPEPAVRKVLPSIGARYRVNVSGLPGRPDIANQKRRKAIFVHGCFWHFHSECGRGQISTRNREFRETKLLANKARDAAKLEALESSAFDLLIVWECELDDAELTARLKSFWWNES